MFKSIMPVLRVEELQRAIDWYTGTLGFALLWRQPNDGEGENAMLESGSTHLMLSTGSHLGGKPAFTGTLYFEMSDVRALWERVKDAADVVWPLSAMDYGTLEFGIRDPDGYLLAFSEAQGSAAS